MRQIKFNVFSAWVQILLILVGLSVSGGTIAQGKVVAIVSVDWEGRILEDHNLNAMQQFRQDYPQVPLLHFLNAAYYTKLGANAATITQKIQSVLRPIDEQGLHIHAWQSLIHAAGVPFQTAPNWSYPGPIATSSCFINDCGHNVPISAYNKHELRQIIQTSRNILNAQGFDPAVSFRAGGWMAEPHVLAALSEEGFKFDSSATVPSLLEGRRWSNRLYLWLSALWGDIEITSQPYLIGPANRPLIELPDNGILADYISAEEMLNIFKANVDQWRQHPETTQYISIGFHQETASRYIQNIRGAIDLIEIYVAEHNIPFEWAQLPLDSAAFEL